MYMLDLKEETQTQTPVQFWPRPLISYFNDSRTSSLVSRTGFLA